MPEWLPAILTVNPWTSVTYDMLYTVFCHDIRDVTLLCAGTPVWIFREKVDGKEAIFWHLTSREQKQEPIPRRMRRFYPQGQVAQPKERYPDMRRCERLSWVKPIIDQTQAPDVLMWDYDEGDGTVKTYLWLRDHDFVVILKRYSNGTRRLITSFYVDREWTRDDFRRKYDNRLPG